MKESLYDYCKRTGKEQLLNEWHPTLNGDLTPEKISRGSGVKVW